MQFSWNGAGSLRNVRRENGPAPALGKTILQRAEVLLGNMTITGLRVLIILEGDLVW